MACSTNTLKIFAIIWDILYAFLGLLMIATGVLILVKLEHFNTAAFVIIGIGVTVSLSSLLGFAGAFRESNRISKSFAGLLIILIVLQVLAIGSFWFFKSTLLIDANEKFDNLWQNQTVPIKPENGSKIVGVERWLECCGNTGPKDYILPPPSCYNNDKLNLDGCRQRFLDFVGEQWTSFSILGFILIAIELICAYFAYVLGNSILNRWRRSKYYSK